jgi:hypothetical protein
MCIAELTLLPSIEHQRYRNKKKTSDEHIMSCLEYPRQLQKEDGGLTIRTMTNKMVCNGTKCLPSNSAIVSGIDNPASNAKKIANLNLSTRLKIEINRLSAD